MNTPDTPDTRTFTERGLWFPLGIALGLGLMVCWNIFFVYQAVQSAPDVDPTYLHTEKR
jgi:hypothetical protein